MTEEFPAPIVSSSRSNPQLDEVVAIGEAFRHFSYDRAKELAERQCDQNRGSGWWHQIFSVLAHLAIAEKNYMGLAFLLPKGFFKKENPCKQLFETLRSDLHKMSAASSSATPTARADSVPSSNSFFFTIIAQLRMFTDARIKLMDFYAKACNMGAESKARMMDFELLLQEVKSVSQHFEGPSPWQSCLTSLQTFLIQEAGMLKGFLGALDQMNHWHSFNALIEMRRANAFLLEWGEMVKSSKESKRLSFMSGSLLFGSVSEPLLYQWLVKLKQAVGSKYYLYFSRLLLKHHTEEKKAVERSKLAVDFVEKFQSFLRKSDALQVCLVFDASSEQDYQGPSAPHVPGLVPVNLPTGLDLFPAVFSYPEQQQQQQQLWPGVVMMLANFSRELDEIDHVVYFYDPRVLVTFFLLRVDPKMTLVAMFAGRKSETDHYVNTFMRESASALRCNAIFARLRPGVS